MFVCVCVCVCVLATSKRIRRVTGGGGRLHEFLWLYFDSHTTSASWLINTVTTESVNAIRDVTTTRWSGTHVHQSKDGASATTLRPSENKNDTWGLQVDGLNTMQISIRFQTIHNRALHSQIW
jgi:hypothetical protein